MSIDPVGTYDIEHPQRHLLADTANNLFGASISSKVTFSEFFENDC